MTEDEIRACHDAGQLRDAALVLLQERSEMRQLLKRKENAITALNREINQLMREARKARGDE